MIGKPSFRRSRSAQRARATHRSLRTEPLEKRLLLSVDLVKDFQGQIFTNTDRESFDNPDTQLAAGPEHLVEVVNARLAFFNKSGEKLSEQRLDEFFAPVGAVRNNPGNYVFVGQSKAAYDELAERFILVTREWDYPAGGSHLLVAVSDDANPEGDWEMHRLNLEQAEKYFFESPGLGWDADGIYVTGAMRKWYGYEIHHGRVLAFDKDTLLDGDPETLAFSDVDLSGSADLLQPAVMHEADPGDPMYFIQASPHGQQGSQLRVIKMIDKLSPDPTFTHFNINVPNYEPPPSAIQPGGRDIDLSWQPWQTCARITTASWRNDRLVAAHNVESDGLARVRWYEINTADVPALTQVGEINQGPDVYTYYPSIEIAASGDLGMTFMQSSETEYLSMYVTGQKAGRTDGVMATPVLAKAGEDIYRNILPWGEDQFVTFAGYWSGMAVDPVDDTFWAANQYALPQLNPEPPRFRANWGTWIVNFSMTDGESASAPVAVKNMAPADHDDRVTTDFSAAAIPLGLDAGEETRLTMRGEIVSADVPDSYTVELDAGDVIGVTVHGQAGLDPTVSLMDSDGSMLIFNDDGPRASVLALPQESPLPRLHSWSLDSAIYYVINTSGSYVIEVGAYDDSSTGKYTMDLVVARPGMEAQPKGTKQILFVDFDGATVNMSKFNFLGGSGNRTLSPMRDFLPNWGLLAEDEDAVIDAILDGIEENLSQDIRQRGLNGDYLASGVPGEFDIEIRNSRDHADEFGTNPYVSRVVIGGTRAETGIDYFFADAIDPGNFSFDDDAVVPLDMLSGPANDPAYPFSLNSLPIHPRSSKIELIGVGVGVVVAHEVGHFFGCYHTEPFSEVPSIMDNDAPRGILDAPAHTGPDGIFGSQDDIDRDFGVDLFHTGEPFRGAQDTLNVIAFGLATGKAPESRGADSVLATDGEFSVTAALWLAQLEDDDQRQSTDSTALSRAELIDLVMVDIE